jgi:hypothetical protein
MNYHEFDRAAVDQRSDLVAFKETMPFLRRIGCEDNNIPIAVGSRVASGTAASQPN